MKYLRIVDWKKFQHYKKRNPPWVKLYSAVLDDDDFDCMPDDSKLLFFCLLPFASRRNNQIRLDFAWLQKKLPIKKIITQKTVQPLIDAGFVECYQDDSVVIADCKQDATPEQRQRQSRDRAETEKNTYLDFVKLTNEEYQKLAGKLGDTLNDRLQALNDYIGSTGKKYKSHYHTILTWERRERRTSTNSQRQGTSAAGGQQNRPARRDTSESSNIGKTIDA